MRNESGVGLADASSHESLEDLISKRIENLRPKLLDLSKRNPLISTKLNHRSLSYVQVVDELPDVLYQNLSNQKPMRFLSLPGLEDDPKDESSREFQNALSEARLKDSEWINAIEGIDQSDDETFELYQKFERELKDRVRETLNMPPRQTGSNISMKQHAINNGISPSYDLPMEEEEHEDGRHTDNFIQTLLLPAEQDRKINGLISKCRSWIQETGIHVLYGAFGYLEILDPKTNDKCFAPLVLLPVEIEKVKTRDGIQFEITGRDSDGECNGVLFEKLRKDYGIEIPLFEGGPLEDYFKEITKVEPKSLSWKVRRQIVFGVFPSARIAMYRDLDTSANSIEFNEALSKLLAGSESDDAALFGDEYEIDSPEIEKKVPQLVLDADSSQFSTIVDVIDGKNLAVEGPPGTGKSQTIVNAIAAALGSGKKILFVAEKSAALSVVKSRLEAIGLGEFVLSLQAEKSTREQVIQSLRDRTEMIPGITPRDLEDKLQNFQNTRAELQQYIQAISDTIQESGLTVHEILSKGIKYSALIESLPQEIRRKDIPQATKYSLLEIESLKSIGSAVERAHKETLSAPKYWKGLSVLNIDKFKVEELVVAAENAANAINKHQSSQRELSLLGFSLGHSSKEEISSLVSALETLTTISADLDQALLLALVGQDLTLVENYLNMKSDFDSGLKELSPLFQDYSFLEKSDAIRRLLLFAECKELDSLDHKVLEGELALEKLQLIDLKGIREGLAEIVKLIPESLNWDSESFAKASTLIAETPQNVLSLRSEPTSDPAAYLQVEKFCKKGTQLRVEKKNIEASFYATGFDIVSEQLLDYITVIKTSNPLSIINPEFRKAKKFYCSIAKENSYSKEQAVEGLGNLLKWKEKHSDFESNKIVNKLFGDEVGLDSDFDSYKSLLTFYQRVDTELDGVSNIGLRKFLKTGDLELVKALPHIDFKNYKGTYEQLANEIEHLSSLIESRESSLEELKILLYATNLKAPDSLDSTALKGIAERVDSLVRLKEALSRDPVPAMLQSTNFAAENNINRRIDKELSAARIIQRSDRNGQAIVDLIERNHLKEAFYCLKAFQQDLILAREALDSLSALSGISAESFVASVPEDSLPSYLENAAQDTKGMYSYSQFETELNELRKHNLDWLVHIIISENAELIALDSVIDAVLVNALAKEAFRKHGSILSKYKGVTLDQCRARLAQLDRDIIELSRRALRCNLYNMARPPRGVGQGRKSEYTEKALIDNELSKKKRYVSVRDLTHRATRALLELKPCWMMSPLAVAQYIRKEDVQFDLLIVDEASQMPPEDALGAILRSKQAMIVGDTNQLPPTSFFKKMIDEEDADEDESVLEESVLELANAAFRPKRRLKWHYRSRHSSLISFSNHMIYNDDLIVFPSASEDRLDMGVSLVSITDGAYSSGINGIEAKAMIDATLEFMKRYPKRSLGLVTLNQKQKDLLQEEMDFAISKNPHAARYIEYWSDKNDGLECFFIKNLENVQGDERDVIYIGTVYGPEKPGGPVMQRFGPINGLAGKRRLNVLFSRAKEQIVTFSSMTSKDIKADESSNAGVYMFKRWLEYSANGQLHSGQNSGRAPDSEFEEFVIDQIKAMGCEPVPQVGVAGYFVDIGIKHPDWPHGYLMGVECDGASYHSSKSARDRDRLREEVLNGLGWHLHRIWSTDWFNDPRLEAERLRVAIKERLDNLKSNSGDYRNLEREEEEVDTEESADDELEDISGEYESEDINSSETRNVEEVSNTEITDAIIEVLKDCPNNSCTVDSLPKRVLKHIGVRTRGKPRSQFTSRVLSCLRNLVYKDVVERYRAKNERIRIKS
ncbi:MAG: DUF4011 domain-containing protein [Cyanobacteriota/Melainabacteria group bacterium]